MRLRLGSTALAIVLTTCATAQSVAPVTREPSHHLTISNPYVRVFKVEVPPHSETLYHQHDYDYLFVSIGDADITSTRLQEKPVELKLKDGQVEFSKGPFAHKAGNLSDQPFRNVTIELLKGGGQSLCEPEGKERCGIWSCGEGRCAGRLIHTTSFVVEGVFLTNNGSGSAGAADSPFLLVAVSD